ncbi:hypothetical protein R1flu_021425 [Riccia fluitans]|uniref:Rhodanese domain-containing protein n=1 Tax=Riccia fluitans TaxID=41844 RepID=A0ABD1ZPB2_9MARC
MATAFALGSAAACLVGTASCSSSSPSERKFVHARNVGFTKSQQLGVRSGNRCSPSRNARKKYFSGAPIASMRDAEQLVKSGVVRNVGPEEISTLLSQGGYKILDVRPLWEREKAYVAGSYHIPLFVEDLSTGLLTMVKKAVQMGQGGWWIGLKLTVKNDNFFEQVKTTVPKGEKLLVVCGEGLRSLLAIEELSDGGYEQLAWLRGGFNNVSDDAVQNVEGPMRLRFATLGGASEYLLKIALFFQKLSSPSQKSEP